MDNTTLSVGTGGDVIRDKDRSGVKTPIVALDLNPAGSESLMAGKMPATVADGDSATLGALADVIVAAGAAGSVSAKLRRISQGLEDLKTLIVLAAGSAVVGKVGIDQTTPGTTDSVTVATAQGAGATIGATGDAIVAAGATGSLSAKLRRVTQGLEDLKTLVVLAAGSNLIGKVGIDQTTPGTTNGVTPKPAAAGGPSTARIKAAGSTNATSVKASAGQVYGWYLYNNTSSVRFFKLYSKASSPTVGTDTPFATIGIPANGGTNIEFAMGVPMGTGIAYAITTGVADSDTGATTADDVHGVLLYN
jgi:hypothetical protein